MHVDDLIGGPVQLRVLLGRRDEGRYPHGGVLDLAHQQLGLHACSAASGPLRRESGHLRRRPPGPASRCPVRPGRRPAPAPRDPPHPGGLEAGGQVVFEITRLHRREGWCRGEALFDGLVEQVRVFSSWSWSLPSLLGRLSSLTIVLATPSCSTTAERFGRPRLGGRWIVELVRQAGGERTECDQLFPLSYDRRLPSGHPEEQPVQEMDRHGEPRLEQVSGVEAHGAT